jgi:S1-C subfamily serine protease
MTLLDIVLAGSIGLAVLGGWRLGFLTRVLSWVGLAGGLLLGLEVLPAFLRQIGSENRTLVVLLALGLLVVSATLGQALGFVIGERLSPAVRLGGLGPVDRLLGALAGFGGAASTGMISHSSTTAPDATRTLRALVGDDVAPDVFDGLRPTGSAGDPPAATGLDRSITDAVSRSVLKIEGTACDRVQDGTGWVVAPDLVLTNAHVVAGERSTTVITDDGRRLEATPVAFDAARDLAVLRTRGLDRPPLVLAEGAPENGSTGGVFGRPGGGPLRIAPFAVARSLDATGRDIYGVDRTRRRVLELAVALRPGDSGAPLVAPDGSVVGVAFAVARDRGDVAYALEPSEVRAVLTTITAAEVSAGPCLV